MIQTTEQTESLFDKVGGSKALERIVCQFYQNILADDSINVFYIQNVSEISHLHQLMQDFLTMVLGGPMVYKGKDMKKAHEHMAIEKKHFDRVIYHVIEAMKKSKVEEGVRDQIVGMLNGLQCDIVTRP